MKKQKKLNRAKIFMPFEALTGLKEAYKEKERVIVPKKDISAMDAEFLNEKIKTLKKRDLVTIVFYDNNAYVSKTGIITQLDKTNRFIVIVNKKINFHDILKIE